ncbi:hypothetical protein ACQEU3_24030 [Spirillospora sp. CA-253888]
MGRRLRDAGEGALGYLGVILLVSAVAVAVTVVAVPEKVSAGLDNAVCVITGRGCDPDQPAASGTPSNGTPSSGSPSGTPSSGVPSSPGAPGQNPPPAVAEDPEVAAARTVYDQALRDLLSVEDEWNKFSLLEELKKLGMDFLFGDIKKCIDKPSFGDCLWALVSVVPWGKIGKLLKTIPKLIKLGDRFLDLKSRLDKARKARDDAKRKLDDALKKKNDKPKELACPLPGGRNGPNGLRSGPLSAGSVTLTAADPPRMPQVRATSPGDDDDLCLTGHAKQRLRERGVSMEEARQVFANEPFSYWHEDQWKIGYWDPKLEIFIAKTVDGNINTIIDPADRQYIENMKSKRPGGGRGRR